MNVLREKTKALPVYINRTRTLSFRRKWVVALATRSNLLFTTLTSISDRNTFLWDRGGYKTKKTQLQFPAEKRQLEVERLDGGETVEWRED